MDKDEEDNFDRVFEDELIQYGGFHKSIAKKVSVKENKDTPVTMENRTEKLVKLCKQLKEGSIDIEEDDDQELQNEL